MRHVSTSNDGSPTAKARPANLVMRSQYKEETSSSSLRSRVNPEDDDERKRVGQAPGNCKLDDPKSEVENSQVSRQEKVLQAARKLGQRDQIQIENEENLQAQGNLMHAHQSSETWNTQTIDTWERSFKIWRRSLECLQSTQHFHWMQTRTNVLTWDCF